MNSIMFRFRNQFKIFNTIVGLNSINVVNVLFRFKVAIKEFFHNESMLKHIARLTFIWVTFANKLQNIAMAIVNSTTAPFGVFIPNSYMTFYGTVYPLFPSVKGGEACGAYLYHSRDFNLSKGISQ